MSLLTDILAYWKLNNDGSGGVSLLDATGNGYALTNNGGVSLGSGIIEGDAVADGTNYLSSSVNLSNLSSASCSAWVKTTDINTDAHFIGTWRAGNVDNQFLFYNPSSFTFYFGNGAAILSVDTGIAINNGNWHHLVCVYDDNSSTANVYIDGTLSGSGSTIGPLAEVTSPKFNLFDAGYSSGFLNAEIDEVGVWNRALTSSEVSSLYNSGAGISYPFTSNLYYNNAENDGDWGNVNNWWIDSGFTIQATALPDYTSKVFIYADVLQNTAGDGVCHCYKAEFHSASFYSPLVLNSYGSLVNFYGTGGVFDGSCNHGISFHDSCSLGENGSVGGNAVFRDQSTNSFGYVNGNAEFHEQTYNYGTINGNATVYYDGGQGTYPIGGIVNGTVTYLGWPAADQQYFNDQVTGSGAAGNWEDKNNWWTDDTFSTRPINSRGTQELPDAGTNIYVYGSGLTAYTTNSTISVNRARFYGESYINNPIVLNSSSYTEFYDNSGCQSVIYGDTYFFNNSYFWTNSGNGYVHGSMSFEDTTTLYQESSTTANVCSGVINMNSLFALKTSFSYKFSGVSDGVNYNIPSGGGGGGFISRLLNLPWFINI